MCHHRSQGCVLRRRLWSSELSPPAAADALRPWRVCFATAPSGEPPAGLERRPAANQLDGVQHGHAGHARQGRAQGRPASASPAAPRTLTHAELRAALATFLSGRPLQPGLRGVRPALLSPGTPAVRMSDRRAREIRREQRRTFRKLALFAACTALRLRASYGLPLPLPLCIESRDSPRSHSLPPS